MEGYVNKEVCVNIELFLLVFVHEKKSASCIRSSRMNVLWFLMDFCQVSYRCGLLKVGKYAGRKKYSLEEAVDLILRADSDSGSEPEVSCSKRRS